MTINTAVWGAERPQRNSVFSIGMRVMEAAARMRSKQRSAPALADLDEHILMDVGLDPQEVQRLRRSAFDMIAQSPSGSVHLVFVGDNGMLSIPVHYR